MILTKSIIAAPHVRWPRPLAAVAGDVCWHKSPPTPHPPMLGELGAGGEMSGTKQKFMLTSGAGNMLSATRGTLIFPKVK